MADSSSKSAIENLCSQLDKKLKVTDANEYNDAINEILGPAAPKNNFHTITPEKIEEVLTRSYQDHFNSRNTLMDLVTSDISQALDTFEKLSPQSVNVLVGCFPSSESTFPLLKELQNRIHYGEDIHVKYLLSIILQLLSRFSYSFEQVGFLVHELCLRTKEPEVKSLMLLIFSQLDKKFHASFNERFLKFMDSLILESEAGVGNDPLSEIVDILTELYPVLTALCSQVLLGKELAEELKKKVLAQDDEDFLKGLLILFSTACIDETVRTHIAENYTSLLETSLTMEQYRLFSALVLIKTWSFTNLQNIDVNSLANILVEGFTNPAVSNTENIGICIEGLAYLSLKASVKVYLRYDDELCTKLAELAKSEQFDSTSYGALVILANLSVSPHDSAGNTSFEPKSLRNLKSYSDLKDPNLENKEKDLENKEEVLSFNKKYLLECKTFSTLNSEFSTLSDGSKQQIIRMIYNVTRDRDCIEECIKQGCTTAVLEYLLNKHESQDLIKVLASRALTRMLIFTNPSLVFKKYSPVNAISPLFELLPNPGLKGETSIDDHITTTDMYEALLALTNLASSDASQGEDVCRRIATTEAYWSVIENLMLDENVLLQRSTLELLSNLMSHPLPIAVKFFNFENPRSLKNFEILVKLLQLQDLESQRAVAAIFANIATTIPFIAQELLKRDELLGKAVDVFEKQLDDAELRQRLIIFFYALAEATTNDDSNEVSLLIGNNSLIRTLETASCMPDIDAQFSEMISIIITKCKRG